MANGHIDSEILHINDDGSFECLHKTWKDRDSMDYDSYRYIGRFGGLKSSGEYTYEMTVENVDDRSTLFTNGQTVTIYKPGTPISMLPESILNQRGDYINSTYKGYLTTWNIIFSDNDHAFDVGIIIG